MQRQTPEGIILACDFCGIDWDMVKPMIEGHQGSILCIDCLAAAIDGAAERDSAFKCTLCLRELDPGERAWAHPTAPTEAHEDAVVCWDCLQQADRAFAKDEDTDWQRRIPPDKRWK